MLKEGDKVLSVRELAGKLAVNQNTILKVYNELCRENIFRVERGQGTFVSTSKQDIAPAERERIVSAALRNPVTLAVQLEVSKETAEGLLRKEFEKVTSQTSNNATNDTEGQ